MDAWKHAIGLARSVYELTANYPREEAFGLVTQMRRSAVCVASNIAEGAARQGDKEFIHFLYVALGSASELDTQAEISLEVGVGDRSQLKELQDLTYRVSQLIHGLIRFLRNRQTH